jgi:hypothetical protein
MRAPGQEPRAKIRARSLSLELPLALSPSRVLPLSCCLSHVRSVSRRRQAPMAYGPEARERGGALLADWARRARGDCAPGAHGDRDGDDGTSSGGNSRCSSAFHSAAVCCLPPLSLSLPLSLVCPSCAPPSLSRVPLGMAWQGMANGEGQMRRRQAGSACASMAWIDGNREGLMTEAKWSGGKTRARAHVGAWTEPSRSLKTVDPTRVHN